jgi:hypothetical protein
MMIRTGSFAFVLALLAAAAPSAAYDVQPRSDDGTPCATAACSPDSVGSPDRDTSERALAAEVISIDESAGRVLLRTALGMVAVPASRSTMAQLSVGDVVMLRVVPDSDDFPSASPPGEDEPGTSRGNKL